MRWTASFIASPTTTRTFKRRLPKLTREQVNQAIRRHLRADRVQIVAVANHAGRSEAATSGRYGARRLPTTRRSRPIREEDKIVQNWKLGLRAGGHRHRPRRADIRVGTRCSCRGGSSPDTRVAPPPRPRLQSRSPGPRRRAADNAGYRRPSRSPRPARYSRPADRRRRMPRHPRSRRKPARAGAPHPPHRGRYRRPPRARPRASARLSRESPIPSPRPAPPRPGAAAAPGPRCIIAWSRARRCRRPSPDSPRCACGRRARDRRARPARERSVRPPASAPAGRAPQPPNPALPPAPSARHSGRTRPATPAHPRGRRRAARSRKAP